MTNRYIIEIALQSLAASNSACLQKPFPASGAAPDVIRTGCFALAMTTRRAHAFGDGRRCRALHELRCRESGGTQILRVLRRGLACPLPSLRFRQRSNRAVLRRLRS